MGWWTQDETGKSFSGDDSMLWGDGPADVMDSAIAAIRKEFEGIDRVLTKAELRAGLEFSLGGTEGEEA